MRLSRMISRALATGLLLIVAIAFACGPTAPAAQEDPPTATPEPTATTIPTTTLRWLGTPPTAEELATLEALPTHTPYPPGYVKPTDPPYVPPLTNVEISATFAAELATEAAQRPREQASGAADAAPTPSPTPTPLTEQVTQFAREMQGRYDVVAHVRAGTSRNLSLPENFDWPGNTKPWDDLTRTSITSITIYHGTLPEKYEIVTPQWLPWSAPTIGQEYILFIDKTFASENDSECSGASVPGFRAPGQRCFNQKQLDAMGGVAGLYNGRQAWIVDGSTAWRIPDDLPSPLPADFDLTKAARTRGDILSLSELESAIKQGIPK